MAASHVLVATQVGGVPELVEDGATGFLVPPRDPDALAEALQKLIADPKLRQRMDEVGHEKALKEFTLDRMLRETERVYKEVLEDNENLRFYLQDVSREARPSRPMEMERLGLAEWPTPVCKAGPASQLGRVLCVVGRRGKL